MAILFIGGLAVLDRMLVSQKITAQTSASQSKDFQNYHNNSFTVVYVVDGDTFDINFPDAKFGDTRIRLLGVDTPETKKEGWPVMHFGPQASEFTKSELLGKNITVLLDRISASRDKYGRLLCYVVNENGQNFNKRLIELGYAYADLRFEHSHYISFRNAMEKAKRSKAGLWREVKPQDMPEFMRQRFGPK